MAVVAPSKQSILQLYASTLRASRAFSSYNFRQYFVQRTKEVFQGIKDEHDPAKLRTFYNEKKKELDVMKRSVIVNQLYTGSRLVVEKQHAVRERVDS